jgi:O-antigen/teichoic acid export membrane protein
VSNPYKNLSGQAVVYGLGNIFPRLLNYGVLTVYYTRRFPIESYGVITELYAYVAILLVILTYGMETGLFKFSSDPLKRDRVYSSVLSSVMATSIVFGFFILLFRNNIATWIGYQGNPEYIIYLGLTLSVDAVASVIFARLRIQNKVRKFAFLKILNVISTVFFVFLFLEILPALRFVATAKWYIHYFKNIEVGYVLISNLLSSSLILVLLLTDLKNIRFVMDKVLLKKVLIYSLPLLISGLAGIFNETIDRILLRHLLPANVNAFILLPHSFSIIDIEITAPLGNRYVFTVYSFFSTALECL